MGLDYVQTITFHSNMCIQEWESVHSLLQLYMQTSVSVPVCVGVSVAYVPGGFQKDPFKLFIWWLYKGPA